VGGSLGPLGACLALDGRHAGCLGCLEGSALEICNLHRRIAGIGLDFGQLASHRLALDIQGKASELLGRLLAGGDEDRRQPR